MDFQRAACAVGSPPSDEGVVSGEGRRGAEAKAKPGRRDELRKLWDAHLRPRAERNPAHELYLYCYDDAEPNTVRLIEVYADRDSLQANAGADWFADYIRESAPLLDGAPEFATAIPVWAKGFEL
ncbi:MAG TPA: antibiotic biosynthesis monooxygenase [Thermoleophilaceae bacterium]